MNAGLSELVADPKEKLNVGEVGCRPWWMVWEYGLFHHRWFEKNPMWMHKIGENFMRVKESLGCVNDHMTHCRLGT